MCTGFPDHSDIGGVRVEYGTGSVHGVIQRTAGNLLGAGHANAERGSGRKKNRKNKRTAGLKQNISFFVFYGHMLNMSRQETLNTLYGEMLDLISCLAVYNGVAVPKKEKLSFEEAIMLE